MIKDENKIKEYEMRYKDAINKKIQDICTKQSEIITDINEIGKNIEIDTNIPNIGITLNNKLVEISQIFKKNGMSLYVDQNEKYNLIGSNFVGEAIMEDLISQLSDGTQKLSEYDSKIQTTVEEKNKMIEPFYNIGPMKKMLLRIKNIFAPNSIKKLTSYSNDSIEDVDLSLSQYKEIDKKIWNYDLESDIAESIVKYVEKNYRGNTRQGLINECIQPTLEKLKLGNLIPQIEEKVNNSKDIPISENNKSWELSTAQKVELQMNNEKILSEYENNTNTNTISIEDIKIDDR